jgi:hypothetical protein
MTTSHDVISAFLDNEPFDARALADALGEPEGRDQLIDLIALRHLARSDDGVLPLHAAPRRSRMTIVIAAAAVLVALVGGYRLGAIQTATASTRPPAATRIVPAPASWQSAGGGDR